MIELESELRGAVNAFHRFLQKDDNIQGNEIEQEKDLRLARFKDGKKNDVVPVRFSEDVLRIIDSRAAHEDRSRSEMIRHIVHRYLFGVASEEIVGQAADE